jgi:(1->4)-alpha-D-glucan 1-alpha-D-glucosylmutase
MVMSAGCPGYAERGTRRVVRQARPVDQKTAPLLKIVDGAPAPSREDVAKLLQTIVGTWPPELSTDDPDRCAAFAGRLAGWQEKASREAKLATDWTAPNQSCEAAARQFLMGLFAADEWRADIAAFSHGIAPAGVVNGLAQTLLKLTAPGVPDIYQGTEFWDLSLVDPDKRRPVNFDSRMKVAPQPLKSRTSCAHGETVA